MKKLLLVTAVAALSVTGAQAADFYGKAGVKLNYSDAGDGDITLDNNLTRFGVKGSEVLTTDLKAVYKLEYGLTIDDGSAAQFTSRDTYAGLELVGLGTVKAGHMTSVDDSVDFSNPTKLGGTEAAYGGSRWNDSIIFESADMSGLNFYAQYKVDSQELAKEGSFAVAGSYEQGPFAVGASYVDLDESDTTVDNAMRASGSYAMSDQITLSGLYQMTEFETSGSESESAFTVAGEYAMTGTPWSLNAQFDMTSNLGGAEDDEHSAFSGGANYKFTDNTVGQVYAGFTQTEISGEKDDSMKAGVAMVHSF